MLRVRIIVRRVRKIALRYAARAREYVRTHPSLHVRAEAQQRSQCRTRRLLEKRLASGDELKRFGNVSGVVAVAHTEGTAVADGDRRGEAHKHLLVRTLSGFAVHSNVGAALLVDVEDDSVRRRDICGCRGRGRAHFGRICIWAWAPPMPCHILRPAASASQRRVGPRKTSQAK